MCGSFALRIKIVFKSISHTRHATHNPVAELAPPSLRNSQLRLFSLNRVRTALRGASVANGRLRDSASAAASGGTTSSDYAQSEEWCIEMLVTQINGDDPAVARAALSVLEEATQDERCLRTLVNRCLPNHDVSPPGVFVS